MHTRLLRIVKRLRARPHMTGAALFDLFIALLPLPLAPVIASPTMRRLVLAQSLLAFVFNTAILALSINIAAGLI